MTSIESLLRREIGLDAASIGTTQIERVVRLRKKGLGLKTDEAYLRLLESSPGELAELIEAVVVTETWFFRDREPFAACTQLTLEWLRQNPVASVRILSVPCSSGEEPYSLAMSLLDAGLAPARFAIDAVDISARALARARHGVYRKNSFRGPDLAFRDHHFHQVPEAEKSLTPKVSSLKPATSDFQKSSYALKPAVRERVQFYHDNLLGEKFLVGHAPYDFIFCRNLLIYFDPATQKRALVRLHQLLAPQGVLFVGPAELPLVTDCNFANANLPMAFACRKAPAEHGLRGAESAALSRATQPPEGGVPSQSLIPDPSHLAPLLAGGIPHPASSIPNAPSDLDVARQLADAGRFEEAIAICEEHLRKEGPCAEAYYLLGLVNDAQGGTPAMEFYRKALYLDPNHYETLLHLSLLLEKSGDEAGASSLRSRLRRVVNAQ